MLVLDGYVLVVIKTGENRTELAQIGQTQGQPFRHFINNV